MLKVQEYLLTHSFEQLYADHGVKARPSVNGSKWSLNYDQLEAKSDDPIACECRGLVLRAVPGSVGPVGPTTVLARCMDRFFNLEDPHAAKIDWARLVQVQEKMDGTMILLYWDPILGESGEWCVATRAVPDADVTFSDCASPLRTNTFRCLFEYAVEKTLTEVYDVPERDNLFREWCEGLDKALTYCYELCTPLNRVVVKYPEYRVVNLCARCTVSGQYSELQSSMEYRLVYYTSDPFIPVKQVVAALVEVKSEVVVIPANLDVSKFTGGEQMLLEAVLNRSLKQATTIDVLPESVGPHFSLSETVFKADQLEALCFEGTRGTLPGALLGRPMTWQLNSGQDVVDMVAKMDPSLFEGAIICDVDYNRVKVKSAAWILASRAKDVVTVSRRGAMEVIIAGKLDEVLPLLDPHVANSLETMRQGLYAWCERTDFWFKSWQTSAEGNRKNFALTVQKSDRWQAPYFALLSEQYDGVGSWLKTLLSAGKLTHTMLDSILKEI